MIEEKIKDRAWLKSFIQEKQKEGKVIGFTSGAFDLVHAGHIDYLEKAKALCDYLIVGINTDDSIKRYKDPTRPICKCEDRTILIASLGFVDYVFNFDENNNNVNITELKPDLYIKAGDYDLSKLSSKPLVESYGGKVVLIPLVHNTSTTKIIETTLDLYAIERFCSYDTSIKYEKKPAIFLDRDGTINEDVEYLSEPEKLKILPNALEGLKEFQKQGYRLVIVTNQAGIGLGYFQKEDFYKVMKKLMSEVSKEGISFDKIYFSPHSKSDNSSWRKPGIGMILQAKKDLNIDLENSFLIGDSTSDIVCAKNAGIKSILVETGNAGKDGKCDVTPDFVANDLLDASRFTRK